MHDLPLRFRNRRVAEQLCEAIGTENCGVDDLVTEGDQFVQVRVILNISKPLCRGKVITLDDGKDLWIPFKYGQLPNLCYWCGCLTHDDQNYDIWIESEGNLSTENQQYGPCIKAAPFVPSKSKVVTVPGYYAMKKKPNPPSNPVQGSKPPVEVVRSEKPSPKVIKPEKEGIFSNQSDLMDLNFRQTNMAHSNLNQVDLNEEGNVSLNATDLEEKIGVGKNFEETLQILGL